MKDMNELKEKVLSYIAQHKDGVREQSIVDTLANDPDNPYESIYIKNAVTVLWLTDRKIELDTETITFRAVR